ncbi:2-succinyl-6-hydroxy-2,4-cyclohexadiene-1-carboxylate synthase [Mesocricetibacter intestinalis]|uniref:Putative 2-succinyl-6-hydroxy-2,4-cyclohexadiene-1-carboxylate synthase n=1 Tax=Mesocricetibacter intestinalis TaxID=1521930 RepID=A0A4R6V8P9_9PAST|nr:2-succinyl-6-hydroxy-2,4-cyclohexadiene-1-carboxylate synthase [Mesocricetibacter intestinalis]TDQ58011.1 2-succinyl-6-hydroxy-2,4-cyclohexadiene-1-carboxylate synthase [Mesocricetibacter intestinalis]
MPCLIFLHGLLGTKQDWKKVCENLPHFSCLALDLPLHGSKKNLRVDNFEDCCLLLAEEIRAEIGTSPYFLIGYSLGGRIALYYALQAKIHQGNLQGLVLEGANPGLGTEKEKTARLQHDNLWAQRFRQERAQQVLADWYQQPVFAHLNQEQRARLTESRRINCDAAIGEMLIATSLGKQPDFRPLISAAQQRGMPIHYLVGEKDHKFRTIAAQAGLNPVLIENAGHNAHRENPEQFARRLSDLLGKPRAA